MSLKTLHSSRATYSFGTRTPCADSERLLRAGNGAQCADNAIIQRVWYIVIESTGVRRVVGKTNTLFIFLLNDLCNHVTSVYNTAAQIEWIWLEHTFIWRTCTHFNKLFYCILNLKQDKHFKFNLFYLDNAEYCSTRLPNQTFSEYCSLSWQSIFHKFNKIQQF